MRVAAGRLASNVDWYQQEDGVWVRPVVVHEGRPLYSLQRRQWDVYRMTPLVQSRAKKHQPKYIGYGGAAGGGKSFLARAVAAAVAFAWPGSVLGLFRRTRPELWRNHISKFLLEVPEEVAVYRARDNELVWNNGSRTVLGYIRGEHDLTKYQGDEYDGLIFEESTHYEWEVVNWLVSNRLRSSGAPGSIPFALFPSNPGGIGHVWFKRWFVDRRFRPDLYELPEDFYFIQAFLHHNEILRKRDPEYERKLRSQPEPYRSWFLYGDWSKGMGQALPQLDRRVHVVQPFHVPDHWTLFGGFDWGYAHWWVFGFYAVSEDGRIFKLDTLRGRRQADSEIIRTIREVSEARKLPLDRLEYVASGRDVFNKRGRDVGYEGETLAERMIEAGIPIIEANNERIAGLRQLREYLHWEGKEIEIGEVTVQDDPMLLFFDVEGNEKCLDNLEGMVMDPDRPEDALKTNADEYGEGGDDDYDETRYAVASRPSVALSQVEQRPVRAWDPTVLQAEAENLRRVKDRPMDEVDDLRKILGLPRQYDE